MGGSHYSNMKLYFINNIKLYPNKPTLIKCSFKTPPYFSSLSAGSFRLDRALLNLGIRQYAPQTYKFAINSPEIYLINCNTKLFNFKEGEIIGKCKALLKKSKYIIKNDLEKKGEIDLLKDYSFSSLNSKISIEKEDSLSNSSNDSLKDNCKGGNMNNCEEKNNSEINQKSKIDEISNISKKKNNFKKRIKIDDDNKKEIKAKNIKPGKKQKLKRINKRLIKHATKKKAIQSDDNDISILLDFDLEENFLTIFKEKSQAKKLKELKDDVNMLCHRYISKSSDLFSKLTDIKKSCNFKDSVKKKRVNAENVLNNITEVISIKEEETRFVKIN